MNKLDLTLRLAKESHRSAGSAADDVDTLVHRLLKDLKHPSAPRDEKGAQKPAKSGGAKDRS